MVKTLILKNGAFYTFSTENRKIIQAETQITYYTAYDVIKKGYIESTEDIEKELLEDIQNEIPEMEKQANG